MSLQKIYTFIHSDTDEIPSTSSKIDKQTEVIQEVVLLGISKLNESAIDKK